MISSKLRARSLVSHSGISLIEVCSSYCGRRDNLRFFALSFSTTALGLALFCSAVYVHQKLV